MKKVAILGGSFDPIHNGHIEIAKKVRKALCIDEVWFMPALLTPLKDRTLTPFKDRCEMIKLAIKPYRKFKLCTLEKTLSVPNYTIHTVRKLKQINPKVKFYWIIGDDQYSQFNSWKNSDELKKDVQIVCVKRHDKVINEDNRVIFLNHVNQIESSTAVRFGSFNQVCKSVKKYILDKQLYIDEIVKSKMSDKRYCHSISTAKTCAKLAKAHGVDVKTAYLCGLLHDYTKELDIEESTKIMSAYFKDYLSKSNKIWHQWTAKIVIKNKLGLVDKKILNAIGQHSTGEGNSKLCKIVYIADKIEPLRPYDVSRYMHVSLNDLNEGAKLVKEDQIKILKRGK